MCLYLNDKHTADSHRILLIEMKYLFVHRIVFCIEKNKPITDIKSEENNKSHIKKKAIRG